MGCTFGLKQNDDLKTPIHFTSSRVSQKGRVIHYADYLTVTFRKRVSKRISTAQLKDGRKSIFQIKTPSATDCMRWL